MRVDIVAAPGCPHSPGAFTELADGFRGALEELGTTDPRRLLIGAHLLHLTGAAPWPDSDTILLNTEVPGSGWFNESYLAELRSHEVWDYAPENIVRLTQYGVDAQLCKIGYHECLERIELAKPDIDVLFYGSMTPRRIPIWQSIEDTGLNCKHLFGVYGAERDAYIARSKIVLNMHAYSESPREDVRLSYLWANKAFVLSETLGEPLAFEYLDRQLPASCVEWAA